MSLFVVLRLHGLTLFIWIVSILTSSVSYEIKTDVTVHNVSTENNYRTLSSVIHSTLEPGGSLETLKGSNIISSFMGEGGPISIAYTTEPVSPTPLYSAGNFDNPNVKNNLATSKVNIRKVTKKNDALSKTVPRKGATDTINNEKENVSTEKAISENIKSVGESSTTTVIDNNWDNTNNSLHDLKLNTSLIKLKIENIFNITTSSTLQPNTNVSLQRDVTKNATMTTTLLREHKAKPTVTVAGPNNDKRSFVSPTRLRSGLPKKIDYVFQVIIVLIALPALGAILFIVYKQGKDCWEKRHYRRMDFLIDGMYND